MRKPMTIIVAAALAGTCASAFAACGVAESAGGTGGTGAGGAGASASAETSGSGVLIPNPMRACNDMSDAAVLVGFDMVVPDEIEGYPQRTIHAVGNEMIQVTYATANPLDSGTTAAAARILIRKAAGAADISGDYNPYPDIRTASIDGTDVTLKGEEGTYSVALWTTDTHTFAIDLDIPASEEFIAALVRQVR